MIYECKPENSILRVVTIYIDWNIIIRTLLQCILITIAECFVFFLIEPFTWIWHTMNEIMWICCLTMEIRYRKKKNAWVKGVNQSVGKPAYWPTITIMYVNFQVTESTGSKILGVLEFFAVRGSCSESGRLAGNLLSDQWARVYQSGEERCAKGRCTCKGPEACRACYLQEQQLYKRCVDGVFGWIWSHEHVSRDFFTILANSLIIRRYVSQCGETGMALY